MKAYPLNSSNDFEITEKDSFGEYSESSIITDSRTFLYEEVILSSIKNNYWFWGRSPSRGNETDAFSEWARAIYGKAERPINEVAILNIFTWTGLIGVILYFIVFWKATYLAINNSKNIFIKILGLYMSFRWLYSWVEDVNVYSLNYYMIWLMMGLCFSKSFREMSDKNMYNWVKSIFEVKYRYIEIISIKKNREKYKNSNNNN